MLQNALDHRDCSSHTVIFPSPVYTLRHGRSQTRCKEGDSYIPPTILQCAYDRQRMDVIYAATLSEAERSRASDAMRLATTHAWSISVLQHMHDAGVAAVQVVVPVAGEDRAPSNRAVCTIMACTVWRLPQQGAASLFDCAR